MPLTWFTFHQNNSGGFYDGPRALIVQAVDHADADRIAQHHGVYFNGVDAGIDCECCGDRWSPSWDDGSDVASLWGEPVNAADLRDGVALVPYGFQSPSSDPNVVALWIARD